MLLVLEELGLKEEPFSLNPNPHFFYNTSTHDKALQRIYFSIEQRTGADCIYGDLGMGKSSVIEILSRRYAERKNDFILSRIDNPSASSEFQFYSLLLEGLNIEKPKIRSGLEYRKAIERFVLEECAATDRTLLILIDEGQELRPEFIDILRMLMNFGSPERRYVHLVIFGQLELVAKMKRKRNFISRVGISYVLNPLDRDETKGLIEHRLKVAGWSGQPVWFTDETIDLIYKESKGVPRTTTNICRQGLNEMAMNGDERVTLEMIEPIAAEEARLYGEKQVITI